LGGVICVSMCVCWWLSLYIDVYVCICLGLARTVYIYTVYNQYMTVYLVISLPKLPYVNRIYMVLANPTDVGGLCVHSHR